MLHQLKEEPIKVIGFDADDTLWVNEPYFRETEKEFCDLLAGYMQAEEINRQLFDIEIENIARYGFGVKGFVLSMIETALKITGNRAPAEMVDQILGLGKAMLDKPVILLDGVEEALNALKGMGYKLIVATKGDLLDQERKLTRSGLEQYFHHVEVMSDKKENDYRKLLKHLEIEPASFCMVGNSLKSDILPVAQLGGHSVHVPFHTTWEHEQVEESVLEDVSFYTIEKLSELLPVFTT